jgi:hypothetical protein
MKKFLVLTLTLALLAITVVPAAAAGGPGGGRGRGGDGTPGGRGPFALAGKIESLDPAAQTVTVRVMSANRLAQTFIGQALTIRTSQATRFILRNANGTCTPITFADLAVGQAVSVNGSLANNLWSAARLTVGAMLVSQS